MQSRRRFLKNTSLVSAGILLSSCEFGATSKKAGIQLYSLRDIIGKDVKGTIAAVSAAGYKEVEMYGLSADQQFFGWKVKEFAALLQQHQLTSPSGHYAPEKFLYENGSGDEVKQLCDIARGMGHRYIVIPWLEEEKRKTIDQYKQLAELMSKAAVICKAEGIELAYHNHDFEFADINGQKGYDILLKETDPDMLKMELDLYWVVKAGYDPVEIFKAYPGRFPMLHVKDMDKEDNTKNTEVGNGSINFKKIFEHASNAGVKHYYVEQENNYQPDILGSINSSSSFLRKKLF